MSKRGEAAPLKPRDTTDRQVAMLAQALAEAARELHTTRTAGPTAPRPPQLMTQRPGSAPGEAGVDTPAVDVRSGLRSVAHRNRRALVPWLIACYLLVVGGLLRLVGWAFDEWLLVAGFAAVAATAAAVIAALRWRARIPAGWGPWAAAGITGIAWLTYTTYDGWSYPGLVWLVVAAVVFGLRWWAHIRRPYPATDPALARLSRDHDVDDATETARLLERWTTHLAAHGGPLPGSRLSDVRPYEHGLRARVHLVPGKQSLQTVNTAIAKISTALNYYPEEIIIEADRSGPPSQLAMQIVTRSPIRDTVYFDRPVYTDGAILLGPYADGLGAAQFLLYREDSMESGYILGSKGSGKSRITEIIALSALAATPTVIVYVDGQGGASSPLLWRHADWRGGPPDAAAMLRALLAMKDYRQLYNQYHELTGFAPSVELPGILVIVDECHRIFLPETAEAWAILAREGRKGGLGILGVSQVTTLDAFGGSDALRSSLVASNGIALRTASKVQSQVFPGLGGVDLMALPKIPGYGYTIDDGDGIGVARTAPFRARFLVDDRKAANLALPKGVRTAEAWFAELAGAQRLDPRTAQAGGAAYLHRHQLAATQRAELERMFTGDDPTPLATLVGDQAALTTPAPSAAATTAATVIAFPTFRAAPPPTADQPAGQPPPSPAPLTTAQQGVWNTVAAGITSPADIAAHLGVSTARVHAVLTQLLDAGHIHRAGHGHYLPTDSDRKAGGEITDTA